MIPLKPWTNGTPENNYQDGTQLDAEDFDSWHREWLALLTAAGITPDAAKFDQLLAAIKQVTWGSPERPTTLEGYGITDALPKTGKAADAAKLGGHLPDFYAKASDLNAGIRVYAAGAALPTQNLGPIWHADFNSLMTWQVFNANGANYTGYASVLVGSLLADTQPTPRAGYISSGALSLSRAAYAALRGWAMHNGVMVAAGVWAAGAIAVADNADGTTFRAYDVRGEFPRYWDAGRGVDIGRGFGSTQSDAIRNITGSFGGTTLSLGWHPNATNANSGVFAPTADSAPVSTAGSGNSAPKGVTFDATRVVPTANENRPRNVALLPVIKF